MPTLRFVVAAAGFILLAAAFGQDAEDGSAADAQERLLADDQDRPATPFNRDILIAHAAELAKQPYVSPPRRPEQEGLTYDQYRAIRFQSAASIWAHEDRTFAIDLLHPGFIYQDLININLVVGGQARRVFFDNTKFDYGPEAPPTLELDENVGYSGFRVRAPLNTPNVLDEFLVFQGASYFRAVAKGQTYGLWARGLAIRTARPEGEEYPVFKEFWFERPPVHADELVIHALLDSPSAVGAYRFAVRRGEETVMDVEATIFARTKLAAYGIAPLMSMFLFDHSIPAGRFDDIRDAVHDSEGLAMVTGTGQRLWRPLSNPRRQQQTSAFRDRNPRGFGLIQRKNRVEDYYDYDARYDLRPSLWVEPLGDWGDGHVELIEIPAEREIHNNIVAYWQPAQPLEPGTGTDVAYRLKWLREPLDRSLAHVVATRTGKAINAERRDFMIAFRGAGPVPEGLKLDVTTSNGSIINPSGRVVSPDNIYRVGFELQPERADVAELRVVLLLNDKPWSETWLYQWNR
jgi:glucans biosynthesis protein